MPSCTFFAAALSFISFNFAATWPMGDKAIHEHGASLQHGAGCCIRWHSRLTSGYQTAEIKFAKKAWHYHEFCISIAVPLLTCNLVTAIYKTKAKSWFYASLSPIIIIEDLIYRLFFIVSEKTAEIKFAKKAWHYHEFCISIVRFIPNFLFGESFKVLFVRILVQCCVGKSI